MAIQQELIGGKIGAMQFGLLQQAMNDEYTMAQEQQTRATNTKTIEEEIYKEYPVFKNDTDYAEILEQAILGASAKRRNQAEIAGKEYVPMNKEDIMAIAEKIIRKTGTKPAPAKEEPADALHQTPTLQESKGKVSVEDQDIDAMMNAKTRGGSIF
jgi:hypothetical protein